MFKKITSLTIWFAALLWVGFGVIPSASAAVPTTITQQGRLLDAAGNGVDGDVSFVFTIYDAATAGASQWTKTQTITLDKGYFSVKLGDTPAFGATVFDGTKTLFLGIKVGQDAELTPRQEITSVPFALHAAQADHAIAADTATNATNATTAANATHATSADTATSATTAGSATSATNATNAASAASADTVKTLSGLFTSVSQGPTAGSAAAACASGYAAVGGGCQLTGGTMTNAYFTFAKLGTTPVGYTCGVAGGSVTATVVCGK